MMVPHGISYWLAPESSAIATGTVRVALRRGEGQREQELVPGRDEGEQPGRHQRRPHQRHEHPVMMIQGVAPSTIAASSISIGRSRMKVVSTQTVNGSVKIV